MLEYITFKRFKKHKEENEANDGEAAKEESKPEVSDDKLDGDTSSKVEEDKSDQHKGKSTEDAPHDEHNELHDSSSEHHHMRTVLKPEDELFLKALLAQDTDGPPPPLPPRLYDHEQDWPSDNESIQTEEKPNEEAKQPVGGKTKDSKDKEAKAPNRLSLLFTRHKKKKEEHPSGTDAVPKPEEGLKPEADEVAPKEAEREKKDLGRVLDRLSLSAKNNKVIPQSKEASELLQNFTQVFKDLVNGVPTAYGDLTKLFEDRDGTINKLFEKLPSSLQKLVMQLPEKLTTTLAPEILAAAAESQGLKAAEEGMKGAAKSFLTPHNLAELVTKPGAIVGMLRAIVDVLKTRWPAFIGMNVIWSVALSLLLVVLWYCYRRGREERILKEKSEISLDGDRVEELPDDPTLPAPEGDHQAIPIIKEPGEEPSVQQTSSGLQETSESREVKASTELSEEREMSEVQETLVSEPLSRLEETHVPREISEPKADTELKETPEVKEGIQ